MEVRPIVKPDDLITNALAGQASVYFTAKFRLVTCLEEKSQRVALRVFGKPEETSFAGACDGGLAAAELTRNRALRRETQRLYEQGLVHLVQHRSMRGDAVTIDYLAIPARNRFKKVPSDAQSMAAA